MTKKVIILFLALVHITASADGLTLVPKEFCPEAIVASFEGLESTFEARNGTCDDPSSFGANPILSQVVEFETESGSDCVNCIYRVEMILHALVPKFHNYSGEEVSIRLAGKLVWQTDESITQGINNCEMVEIKKRVIVDLIPGEQVSVNLYLNNTWTQSAYARIVKARVVDTFQNEGGLTTCYGDCSTGSVIANNSVSFNIPFGKPSITATNLGSTGAIRLTEFEPSASLCIAHNLSYFPRGESAEVIQDPNALNCLRQIKGADGLADIVTLNSYEYEIRLYSATNVLGKSGNFYQTQNSPAVTYSVLNPNASTSNVNTLLILEDRPGITTKTNKFEWRVSNQAWTLTRPNELVGERRTTTWNTAGDERTEVLEKYNPTTLAVDYKVSSKYKLFDEWDDNGDRVDPLIERTIGDGTNALVSTYDYYSNTNDNGYMKLKEGHYAGGGWEYKKYDTNDRLLVTYSAYATNDWNTVYIGGASVVNTNLCRTTSLDYSLLSGASDNGSRTNSPRTTIEFVLGKEVARNYLVVKDREEQLIQCQTPGAAWNNSSNLVTINKYITSGIFTNALQSVSYPDGTFTLYDYQLNTLYRTNTVWHGEPNTGKTAVIDGTKTVSVFDAYEHATEGKLLSETQYDIASGIKLSEVTYSNHDIWKRPQTKTFLDGTTEIIDYGCCGIEAVEDKEGTITGYTYDDLGRETLRSTSGIVSQTYYDSAGNTIKRTRTGSGGGSTITLETMGYDLAGRLTTLTNALNGVTTTSQTFGSSGQSILTTTNPDNGTSVQTYCVDGQLEKITGTAVSPVRYEYGVEQLNGVWRLYTKEIKLDGAGSDTSEWTTSYVDMVGRPIRTVFADATTPYPYSEFVYNVKGQLERMIDPDGVRTLYVYNDLGEVEYTVVDKDQDWVVDYNGTDRVQRSVNDAVVYASTDTHRSRNFQYQTDSTSTETLNSISYTSTDGLKSWNTLMRDASTAVTTLTEIAYPTAYTNTYGAVVTKTVTTTYPDTTKKLDEYASGRLVLSQTKDTSSNVLTEIAYEYDAHGRQSKIIDKRNGATAYSYNNADQLTEVRLPSQPVQVTTTYYDDSLRAFASVLPNGQTVYYDYYPTGNLKAMSGGPNYPVEYTYDAQGRKRTMKTWKDFDGNTGASTTRWNYDQYRGWLKSKDYPIATTGLSPGTEGTGGPNYTYTDAGRLKTRVWKRGITTTYNYNTIGDLTSVSYSDSTPTTTYTYKRHGLVNTAVKNGMTATLSYNDAGGTTSELFSGGTLSGHGINYTYDNLLRLTNARAKIGSDNVDAVNTYDSTTGRLQKITHSDWLSGGSGYSYEVSFEYEQNSTLINQIDYGTGGKFETSRVYDGINRLTDVTHIPGSGSIPISARYRYNTMNQRVEREEADESYWKYQYDSLGQVVSGKRYWPDDTLVEGQDFEYAFDDIGNRTSTGGRDSSVSTYDANYLNQYDDRTVAGKIDVMGVANPTASVTVNSNTSTRKGDYFHYPLSVSNGSGPVNQSVTVTSNYGSTQSATSNVYVPQSTENYTYDADGNLLSDGRWDYTWDAENRLIEMDTISAAPSSADIRMVFEYDYKGRRIRKLVYDTNDSLILERKYLYDQWNLQAELDGSNVALRKYMWGPDLSGSTHGAGGVGGLLLVCDIPSYGNKDYYFAGADGNGNISVLVDAGAGTVEGRYEYGPFGERLRVSGSAIAGNNPFRFSSKYTDTESGFLYYGFRYYNPETGRWLNRDPIEEKGGNNLYGFIGNKSVNMVDRDGRSGWQFYNPFGPSLDPDCPGPDEFDVAIAVFGATLLTPVPGDEAIAAAAVAKGISRLLAKCKGCTKIRCKIQQDKPHHYWMKDGKKCWMNHLRITCYLKGQKGRRPVYEKNFFPYGPCYKFKHGWGGIIH